MESDELFKLMQCSTNQRVLAYGTGRRCITPPIPSGLNFQVIYPEVVSNIYVQVLLIRGEVYSSWLICFDLQDIPDSLKLRIEAKIKQLHQDDIIIFATNPSASGPVPHEKEKGFIEEYYLHILRKTFEAVRQSYINISAGIVYYNHDADKLEIMKHDDSSKNIIAKYFAKKDNYNRYLIHGGKLARFRDEIEQDKSTTVFVFTDDIEVRNIYSGCANEA